MGGGQNVKERTARITGNKNTGALQLLPRQELAAEKQQPQAGSHAPPGVEPVANSGFESAARHFEREARRQQHGGVHPKDGRFGHAGPIVRKAAPSLRSEEHTSE